MKLLLIIINLIFLGCAGNSNYIHKEKCSPSGNIKSAFSTKDKSDIEIELNYDCE
jgi:hypothetical protein